MSDVILDEGEQVSIVCSNLNVQGHDLLLDSPKRRGPGGPPFRRAMVHDSDDALTINYAGDYPGGVRINGLTELRPLAGDLIIRGGITYEAAGVNAHGQVVAIPVSVDEALSQVMKQIRTLTERVKTLESRP